MNILKEADIIIHRKKKNKIDRSEYGPMDINFEDASKIASILRNKKIEPLDICAALIAIKIAREKFTHKEDNLLDLVAYIGAYNDFFEKKNEK